MVDPARVKQGRHRCKSRFVAFKREKRRTDFRLGASPARNREKRMHRSGLRAIFHRIGKRSGRQRARTMAYDLPEQRIARRVAIRRHEILPSIGNLAIGYREENNVGCLDYFCRIRISSGCRFLSRCLRVFWQQRTVSRNRDTAIPKKLAEGRAHFARADEANTSIRFDHAALLSLHSPTSPAL